MKFARGDTRTAEQINEMHNNQFWRDHSKRTEGFGKKFEMAVVSLTMVAVLVAGYGIGKDVVQKNKAEVANLSQTGASNHSNPFLAKTGNDDFEKGIIAAKEKVKASTSQTVSGPTGSGGFGM